MTTKSPLKSKTIWGVLIASLPTLLPLVGLSMSESDAVLLNQTVDAIITAIGTLLAVYGRVVATDTITVGKAS